MIRNFIVFLMLAILANISLYSNDIVINEIQSSNQETITDKDGDTPDWIELYNNTDKTISLEGYALSDDPDDIMKWRFTTQSISAKGFLLVLASKKEVDNEDEIHANFKISSDGETIFLSNKNGELIEEFEVPTLDEDASYGCYPDGGEEKHVFSNPTPGTSNIDEFSPVVTFFPNSGFHADEIDLNMKARANDTIVYTLDCSLPQKGSLVYSNALGLDYTIDIPNKFSNIPTTPDTSLIHWRYWVKPDYNIPKARIIRARILNNTLHEKIYTKTYFIEEGIFEKYDMPVISLVTDSLNFFGHDSGIYVQGAKFNPANPKYSGNSFQRGDESERPVHIEYFNKEGELKFAQDAGIRIHGKSTRMFAQKSLRLYARKEYGEKYFNHSLFPHRDNDKYKRFILRATMGDWSNNTFLADVVSQDIVRDLNIDYQDYRPAVVFLNGEYWGIYTIRENTDKYYIENHYDIDNDMVYCEVFNSQYYPEVWDILEDKVFSDDTKYNMLEEKIDVDNVIDYYIAEIFLRNYDWPDVNNMAWFANDTVADTVSKMRQMLYDCDACLIGQTYNMFEHATANDSTIGWPNTQKSTMLFRQLLKNKDFEYKFTKRFFDLLKSTFNPYYTKSKLDTIKKSYEPEVPAHIKRWAMYDSIQEWENDIKYSYTKFLDERPAIVRTQFMEFFDISEDDTISVPPTSDLIYDFVIAPNPSNGEFSIYSLSDSNLVSDIMIRNITGTVIYEEKQVVFSENSQKQLNLLGLPIGAYFLTLRSPEIVKTIKFNIIR